MSSDDPKKPFDSAPSGTPDLLQQDLSLDRRRRVPTFQELQAVSAPPPPVPTQKVPPNLVPRQAAQAAQPGAIRTAPPTQAERWVAQQRPNLATPTQPVNHVTAAPQPPRVAPPSPVEYAQQPRTAQPMPQVTPLVPSQGGVMPEGQRTPARPQPVHQAVPPQQQRPTASLRPAVTVAQRAHTPQPSPEEALEAQRQEVFSTQATSDVLERPTMPQGAPRRAAVLPPEMLVTQPGTPGPFAQKAGRPAPAPAPKPVESAARVVTDDVIRAEPAALWRRMGAWIFDLAFVVGLVAGFLFIAISVIAPKNLTLVQQLTLLAVPGLALAGVLAFVYTTLFAFLWNGRTPGRRVLGIHLVDNSGHAPGPVRALLRAGLSLVSFSLFMAGFWLALFDRHGQTLHDKLTRTFVVRLQDA